jgi:hypothetical protein
VRLHRDAISVTSYAPTTAECRMTVLILILQIIDKILALLLRYS